MPNSWVFLTGFVELAVACLLVLYAMFRQIGTFKVKSNIQPVKRYLLTAEIFLLVAAVPLMIVYADYLWFRDSNILWITNVAVLANATAKLIIGIMLYLIYKFK